MIRDFSAILDNARAQVDQIFRDWYDLKPESQKDREPWPAEAFKYAPGPAPEPKDYRCRDCRRTFNDDEVPYDRLGRTRCPHCRSERYRWTRFERGGPY